MSDSIFNDLGRRYLGRYSFYTFCLLHIPNKVFEQTEI